MRTLTLLAALALGMAPMTATPAEHPSPRPTHLALAYDGVLLVKVLDMTIDQTFTPDGFSAAAALKTSGPLALFKRVDVHAASRGSIEADRLRPAAFEHVNADGQDNRHVQVRWTGDAVSTEASPAYPDYGAPPATLAQKLAAADPLTQLARIAATPTDAGPCREANRFFDGRQLYEVTFGAPAARTQSAHEAAMGLTSPLTCPLSYNEVAGFDAKPLDKRNQGLNRPMSIEFARLGRDGLWVITAIKGRTPLGEARIELARLRVQG